MLYQKMAQFKHRYYLGINITFSHSFSFPGLWNRPIHILTQCQLRSKALGKQSICAWYQKPQSRRQKSPEKLSNKPRVQQLTAPVGVVHKKQRKRTVHLPALVDNQGISKCIKHFRAISHHSVWHHHPMSLLSS